MNFPELVTGTLALWFLAAALCYWDGPADLLLKLRQIAGTEYTDENGKAINFVGQQLQSFWCCVFWLSFPVTLILFLQWYLLIPFAITGGALLLSRSGGIVWQRMTYG